MTTHFIKSFLLTASVFCSVALFAQDSTGNRTHFYTGIYNELPEYSNYPVIGLVNICSGNQNNAQIGFANVNQKNLNGVQIGFTNAIGGKANAAQIGFSNVGKDSFDGAAIGFINVAASRTDGAQAGFINVTRQCLNGAQVGFVNLTGITTDGAQVGFVNACKDSLSGMQVGFVNAAGGAADGVQVGFVNGVARPLVGGQVGFVNIAANHANGVQVGFVNATGKTMNGVQLGFVNVADSVKDGVPLGFISYVRKGGFKAIEVSSSEMYPVNLAFKTGVNAFYTTFIGSYNADLKNKFALGAGFGSNIRISENFFFNPEVLNQFTFEEYPQQIVSLNTLVGFTFAKRLALIAGPDVSWIHRSKESTDLLYEPTTSLYMEKFDARNSLHIGAKAAFRISF